MITIHTRRRGWLTPGSPRVLTGDTRSDIAAASANGIRSVAVANFTELDGDRP